MNRITLLKRFSDFCRDISARILSFDEHADFYTVSIMVPKNPVFKKFMEKTDEQLSDVKKRTKDDITDVLKETLDSMNSLNDRFDKLKDSFAKDLLNVSKSN